MGSQVSIFLIVRMQCRLFLSFFQFNQSASFFLLPPLQGIASKTIPPPVTDPDECQDGSKNKYPDHDPFSNIIHGINHLILPVHPKRKRLRTWLVFKKICSVEIIEKFLTFFWLRPHRRGNSPWDNGVLPVHHCVRFFFPGNSKASQSAIPPPRRQGWRNGDHMSKKRISSKPKNLFFNYRNYLIS